MAGQSWPRAGFGPLIATTEELPDPPSAVGPTGGDFRVIQVHPTLRCNLRCLHCYSASSPAEHGSLALPTLTTAVSDAAAQGFNVLGVSGGEPLMYEGLARLLEAAKASAMVTSVTTNGLLLSASRLAALRGLVDLVAVSVDGMPATHDLVRASSHAFEGVRRAVALLRDSGQTFGLVFTLTLYNLDELEWVAEFGAAVGATLLQVHPLEEAGRAGTELVGEAPDDRELACADIEAQRLQAHYTDRMRIHVDAADRRVLRAQPARGFAAEPDVKDDKTLRDRPLADLVAPIVIEHDGTVVPIQYGFSRRYAIADITRERLADGVARWRTDRYRRFIRLCHQVHEAEMARDTPLPLFNWYSAITQASGQLTVR
jgi:MoaA/NifB/PqqE/SkfB family radical SAM enzyme